MKISEAALRSGASPRALRLYEDEGLIVPGRCCNGYRDYCLSTLDRVRTIRPVHNAGLSVRLIRDVLPAVAAGRELDARTRRELVAYQERLVQRIVHFNERRASLASFLDKIDASDGLTFTHKSNSYGSDHNHYLANS